MHWASVSDFISMGGHGFWVWAAWGAALCAVAAENIFQSARRRAVLREVRRLERIEAGRAGRSEEE
ncbi:MAG: heme exporter protein CcmD [Sutterellaceae bacterium]|nr:heme exporter protein CcmD [Sutterellaceae bacterium]MDY2869011.1 heme exporter protein CcmD [Mesosutterella sp.]